MAFQDPTVAKSKPEPRCVTRYVHVRAKAVHDEGNGIFTIEVPAVAMSDEMLRFLDEQFPNTMTKLEDLLAIEAMIGMSIDDAKYRDLMKKK